MASAPDARLSCRYKTAIRVPARILSRLVKNEAEHNEILRG